MALSTNNYKGARDFYPEDKQLQTQIFNQLRRVVESFGYKEYDAPLLESVELYKAKTGSEIVNEQTYVFKDRGDREVVIRPEMTPSVSRMVAKKRHMLNYPLRWYSIPNLWRYERSQRGRFREHWQLNVDIFGIEGIEAEIELIQITSDIFKSFSATDDMFQIKLNSRKLVDSFLTDVLKLSSENSQAVIKIMDRKAKTEESVYHEQLDVILDGEQKNILHEFLNMDLSKPIDKLKNHPSINELVNLINQLKVLGISNVIFSPDLMRGFDYYTDIVFEVFDTDPANNRSMMGGGRYDGLVGLFGVDNLPVVGFGLGDATLENFLNTHNLLPKISSNTEIAVIGLTNKTNLVNVYANQIRKQGINVVCELSERKLPAKIKWAENEGAKYIIVLGEEEIHSNSVKLKNLETRQEVEVTNIDQIRDYIK